MLSREYVAILRRVASVFFTEACLSLAALALNSLASLSSDVHLCQRAASAKLDKLDANCKTQRQYGPDGREHGGLVMGNVLSRRAIHLQASMGISRVQDTLQNAVKALLPLAGGGPAGETPLSYRSEHQVLTLPSHVFSKSQDAADERHNAS